MGFPTAIALPATSFLLDFLLDSSLKMEALCSSETLYLYRMTWRHIPQDGILLSHRCEKLKSDISSFPSSQESTADFLGNHHSTEFIKKHDFSKPALTHLDS
jgi:hypothetical protein